MHRRTLLCAGASLPLLAWLGPVAARSGNPRMVATAFDADTVPGLARAAAASVYVAPARTLPPWLAAIGYDAYRDYRYRPGQALWRGDGLPFQAQFFHRGFLFKDRVAVAVVADGRAEPLPYRREMFSYDQRARAPDDPALGFAGLRLHAAFQRPDYFDELCVFLGASYFRALGRGQGYGLSARGLALGSGDPGPEEFPLFKAFWLERPARADDAMVVHALLDSPSAAASFRFAIVPGDDTVFDIDMRLFPRVALANAGIAPLTSMFEFDAGDRVGIDDFRPAVHDSDGLALLNGQGEQAWRPLRNPPAVEHSGFQDASPRGFGLVQRKRAFADFLDAEAGYEKRPSAWVEPLDDWGRGEVHLVEIPTANEYHDNIVAFWRPATVLEAGREHRFRYRLHWCPDHPWNPPLARITATRTGAAAEAGARLYVIDIAGGRLDALPAGAQPRVQASASAGTLRNVIAHRNAHGWRISLELAPGAATVIELRARLEDASGALSETWLSRWTRA